MTVMDRYAVVGNPVQHSLSPTIHNMFARQTGQRLSYERIEAPLVEFEQTVSEFFAAGGLGVNVTLPFKGAAANWVGSLTPLAEATDAVNTISIDNRGGFVGHNTDGPGLSNDLKRLLRSWKTPHLNPGDSERLRVLLLGAGGAARGVARPLLEEHASELIIANRTVAKAEALKAMLGALGEVSVCALADLGGRFDLVVNATSAGLDDQVPAIDPAVVQDAVCYDMVYGGETAFCQWALANGAAEVHDGLGMLVEQAALAYELWRGVLPDTTPVLAALRSE
jgi:shikimate dehydrogenase